MEGMEDRDGSADGAVLTVGLGLMVGKWEGISEGEREGAKDQEGWALVLGAIEGDLEEEGAGEVVGKVVGTRHDVSQ